MSQDYDLNYPYNHSSNNEINREEKWNKPLDIKIPAIEYSLSGENITIAFIDTGINLSHETFQRFSGNIPFYNSADNLNPYTIQDVMGHGSHVASIALGNSDKFQGIAPNASCIMVNVFDEDSFFSKRSSFIKGYEWLLTYAQSSPVDIISISIGTFDSNKEDDQIREMVKNFTDMGIIVVASAGNFGYLGEENIIAPATSPNVISVGGYNTHAFESYLNTGLGPGYNNSPKPDIIAPAVNELGADISAGNNYKNLTGNSQSAPYISGMIALLLEYSRRNEILLNWKEIKWLLSTTALNLEDQDSLQNIQHNNKQGWGLAQLSPIIQFLKFNQTKEVRHGNQSYLVKMGENGNSRTLLFPIDLEQEKNYRIRINSTNAHIGLFSNYIGEYGNPELLFSTNKPTSRLTIKAEESNRYYITVKLPLNTDIRYINLTIEPISSEIYYIILVVSIISFISISNYFVHTRSKSLEKSV